MQSANFSPLETMEIEYKLSEPQAIAILAALKLIPPESVRDLLPETQGNLSRAYHRLNGALCRSLRRSSF